MAITEISVNYASLFANGTLSVASAGTTWSDEARIADYFQGTLATTDGTPSGLTEIEIDQGATAADYLNANRIIIPPLHNIDVALTLEYSNTGAWGGEQTAVSLSASTPTPGTQFSATFTKVTAAAANRYWRLSFTKTDEALEIPEVWLTEQIVLGESETTADSRAGYPEAPVSFPLSANILIHRTLGRVRSAVQRGISLRRLTLVVPTQGLHSSSFADWEGLITGTLDGLKPFYIDDPRGVTWMAEILNADEIPRDLDKTERWGLTLEIQEVP